ncbi:hypothetical protein [Salisediminibacterium halotolerans]|uniref:hypothetical protein n=1 Tax=Salisediminibacterium halotolerans TaxID=517425 RepID=UPI000EAE5C6A|nr:hypothetical protein [Salisediminibacterium halotolerans]RLJ78227.1 hypothetical protein BCL39_0698 [Actinophytocola xinjiangensis]RPE88434.1 hypothetical protein EDD67_0761 [Salisediminibacterium halotolerans]TWG37204.1 hypothetical protein BCL52_0697 [Salisediminibacterium halotolerans]GEL07138.1 hypothetical protein SHA02_05540 [Salisediminibacterium halotolerans]
MSVEINLISAKDKTDAAFRPAVILFVLLLVLALLLTVLYASHIREETADKKEELDHLRADTAELENSLQDLQDGGVKELEEAEEELTANTVPHSPVLQELVRALPEESMLYSYDYSYPHRIDMKVVLFDIGDAAAYQHRLNAFSWTNDARLDYAEGEEPGNVVTENDEETGLTAELETEDIEPSRPLWFEDYLPHYFSSYTIELDTKMTNEELADEEIVDLPPDDDPGIADFNNDQEALNGETGEELADDD